MMERRRRRTHRSLGHGGDKLVEDGVGGLELSQEGLDLLGEGLLEWREGELVEIPGG